MSKKKFKVFNKTVKKWSPSVKNTAFLQGTNLTQYNYHFKYKFNITSKKPIIIVNSKTFFLESNKKMLLNYTFKEGLNKQIFFEFFKFYRFMGNVDNKVFDEIYPYLKKKLKATQIYAIRLRGNDLIAYCLVNNSVKIIKLTTLMSTLGLQYYKTLLGYITAPLTLSKGKFLKINTLKLAKAANRKIKPNFLRYTRWPVARFFVGALLYHTTDLLWQKMLMLKFKKSMFNPRENYYKYYDYKRFWNKRLKKWTLKVAAFEDYKPLFASLLNERAFYKNLFQHNRVLKHTPMRGRFVFSYADKKFMKRFFIQSLVKQGKRLRAINWYKDVMAAVKKRLSCSRITNFKAFYFTLMRLKPRYWLRKFKRGRRTEHFPTWIKDKRNKAEAVRLFLKVAKSTAPGAKNVSKQRIIDLILLNTFLKKNDAYDALVSYWQTVRKNMHNMNFVPWV